MKKIILLSTLFFYFLEAGYSQAGKIDNTIGFHGIVPTDLGGSASNAILGKKVLLLPDGSMYAIFNVPYRTPYNESGGITLIAKRQKDGSPDLSYARKGFSTPVAMEVNDAALQPDGKIVVAGTVKRLENSSLLGFARYNTDGTLDTSFSKYVKLTTVYDENLHQYGQSVVIQSDGKIILTGFTRKNLQTNLFLLRYNTDGTVDTTFSKAGRLIDSEFGGAPSATALQSDGKIVVTGNAYNGKNYDFSIARYNADGTLDTTFSKDGKQTTDLGSIYDFTSAVVTQNDGKITVAGKTWNGKNFVFALARYNSDGGLDTTFSGDGKQTTTFGSVDNNAYSLIIAHNGKIVAGGGGNDFALARYNADGTLDITFGKDGKQTTDLGSDDDAVQSIAIQNDGKIVAAGNTILPIDSDNTYYFNLARYNTDGTVDTAFSKDGKQPINFISNKDNAKSVAIQNDGKIVVVGTFDTFGSDDSSYIVVARYNTDARLDNSFSDDGKLRRLDLSYRFANVAQSVVIQSDGKIVVLAGGVLARYNTDGISDDSFTENVRRTDFGEASSVVIQGDGKIVLAGNVLVRYNTDGTSDTDFSENVKKTIFSPATSVAIQSDGKIVVGGGSPDFALTRYNTNGTLDSTFSEDGMQTTDFDNNDEGLSSLAIQSDGKIVAAGSSYIQPVEPFTIADQPIYHIVLARYNTDGSLDNTFDSDGKLGFTIASQYEHARSVAIQSDEKILVAGNSDGNFVIARLNTNGSLDQTFRKDDNEVTEMSGGNDFLNDIAISGNKLYVVGRIAYLGGVLARYFLDNESNTPPTVSLNTPTANTTYTAPANMRLTATASDADGTISKVEFYDGTTLLHTETIAPYGFTWRDVRLGEYTLTAKAYDNSGNITISDAVHISVVSNKPPTVSIITPANNEHYAAPAYIHFEAAASDTDGRITRVEFYNGSTLLRTEYKSPYTYVWKNIPEGTYTITAVASDNWGAQTTSDPITVKVKSRESIVSNRPSFGNNKTSLKDTLRFRLSPNPGIDIINIYITGLQQNKSATLSIISASGIVIKKMQISSSATQLDVSSFTNGVYSVKVTRADKVLYKQFVKLKEDR